VSRMGRARIEQPRSRMLKLPIHDPEVRTVVTCVIGFHLSAKAVPRLFSQGCSAKAVQPRLFSQEAG
jgi:hypothetical protein